MTSQGGRDDVVVVVVWWGNGSGKTVFFFIAGFYGFFVAACENFPSRKGVANVVVVGNSFFLCGWKDDYVLFCLFDILLGEGKSFDYWILLRFEELCSTQQLQLFILS